MKSPATDAPTHSIFWSVFLASMAVVLTLIFIIIGIFSVYNAQKSNPLMVYARSNDIAYDTVASNRHNIDAYTNTPMAHSNHFNDAQHNARLDILADEALNPSLDDIAALFKNRHPNLNILVRYLPKTALRDDTDNTAHLWLFYDDDVQTSAFTHFDFVVMDAHQSDTAVVSNTPYRPPLTGAYDDQNIYAELFYHFLLSSLAQDVFIAHNLQDIEPYYDTAHFFSPNS